MNANPGSSSFGTVGTFGSQPRVRTPTPLGPRVVTESMLAGPLPRMEQVILVCFTLDSGREASPSESPLSANSGHHITEQVCAAN